MSTKTKEAALVGTASFGLLIREAQVISTGVQGRRLSCGFNIRRIDL